MNDVTELQRTWEDEEQRKRDAQADFLATMKKAVPQGEAVGCEVAFGLKGTLKIGTEAPVPAKKFEQRVVNFFRKNAVDLIPLMTASKDPEQLRARLAAFGDPNVDEADAVAVADLPLEYLHGIDLKSVRVVKRMQIKLIGRHSFKQQIEDVVHIICGARFDFDRMDLKAATKPPVFVAFGKRPAPKETNKISGTDRTLNFEGVRDWLHVSAPLAAFYMFLFSRVELNVAIIKKDSDGVFYLTPRGCALMKSRDLAQMAMIASHYQAIFPTEPIGLKKIAKRDDPYKVAEDMAAGTVLNQVAVKQLRIALGVEATDQPPPPGVVERKEDDDELPKPRRGITQNLSVPGVE